MLKKSVRIPTPEELPWEYANCNDKFPDGKGLYFVKPFWGLWPITYIGITQDRYGFRGRWRNHQKLSAAQRTRARVYFWAIDLPRISLEKAETIAIQHHDPAWNIAKKRPIQNRGKIRWLEILAGLATGALLAFIFA